MNVMWNSHEIEWRCLNECTRAPVAAADRIGLFARAGGKICSVTVEAGEPPWRLSVRREVIGRQERGGDHGGVDGTLRARRRGVVEERWS